MKEMEYARRNANSEPAWLDTGQVVEGAHPPCDSPAPVDSPLVIQSTAGAEQTATCHKSLGASANS